MNRSVLKGARICLVVGAAVLSGACQGPDHIPNVEVPEMARQGLVTNHGVQVGVRCEQNFSGAWQPSISPSNNRCVNFKNTMAENEPVEFYYNLHGGAAALQSPDTCGWNCGYVDSVDSST